MFKRIIEIAWLRFVPLLVVSLVWQTTYVQMTAAEPKKDDSDTVVEKFEPLVIPIIGGSTDIGYMFGLAGALARLDSRYYPYRWKANAAVALSIKEGPDTVELPVHYYAITFDIPQLVGGRLRLFPRIEFRRIVNAGYYGMGNASSRDRKGSPERNERSSEEEFRRYQYLIMYAKARLKAWILLGSNLHVRIGGDFQYIMPEMYEGSVLEEESNLRDDEGVPIIHGTEDHALVNFNGGLVYDSRDHEANPTRGMFHEAVLVFSPGKLLGLNYPYSELLFNSRYFFPLFGEYLVLALRLKVNLYFGDVPYHELSLDLIRGIPARRYHGKVKLIGNLEVRSMFWRFELFDQRFGLGATAFLDTGRVYTDYQYNPEFDGNGLGLKYGMGAGIRIQWGETRVLRADVAYSPNEAAETSSIPIAWYLRMDHFF